MSKASPAASSRVRPITSWPRAVADGRQHRVAAAGDEAEEGRLERVGLEEVGGDVALQVVDRDQRQAPRRGQRLRRAHPDQEGPDQARARGHGDGLDVLERGIRLGQGVFDNRNRELEVMARGDLGDDAAEARVRLGLRGDRVGENPAAVQNRGAGVVAGSLDSENQGQFGRPLLCRLSRPFAQSALLIPANGGRESPLASTPVIISASGLSRSTLAESIQSSHMISASSPLSW